MILEGIVTTVGPRGACHAAPMGPHIDEADIDAESGSLARLTLKPFATSSTFANLAAHGEGVFHVTDDALLFAKLVLGENLSLPTRPAHVVRGFVLEEACVAHEFRVIEADTASQRGSFVAEVVASHVGRPFRGLNRAVHAVIEGAILISRLGLIEREEIARQLEPLAVLVEKTGGAAEREAFEMLRERAR
jgi:hypothetical protein